MVKRMILKQFIAIVLMVVFIIGTMPIGVFAEEQSNSVEIQSENSYYSIDLSEKKIKGQGKRINCGVTCERFLSDIKSPIGCKAIFITGSDKIYNSAEEILNAQGSGDERNKEDLLDKNDRLWIVAEDGKTFDKYTIESEQCYYNYVKSNKYTVDEENYIIQLDKAVIVSEFFSKININKYAINKIVSKTDKDNIMIGRSIDKNEAYFTEILTGVKNISRKSDTDSINNGDYLICISEMETVIDAYEISTTEVYEFGGGITGRLEGETLVVEKTDATGNGNMDDFNTEARKSPIIDVEGIKNVVVGDGVKSIGKSAFVKNPAMKISGYVTIGNDVEVIDVAAFAGNSITTIHLGEKVRTIGGYSFMRNQIKALTLPNSVENIDTFAFCYNPIEELVIPDNVKNIGIRAFLSNRLQSVTIGKGVETIEGDAFSENMISNLILSEGLVNIRRCAFACNNIKSIDLPNSLNRIEDAAFARNEMTSVHFGNGLEHIGHNAFGSAQLEKVQFPDSLKSIGDSAFSQSKIVEIKIGDNVNILDAGSSGTTGKNFGFKATYDSEGKAGKIYVWDSENKTWKEKKDITAPSFISSYPILKEATKRTLSIDFKVNEIGSLKVIMMKESEVPAGGFTQKDVLQKGEEIQIYKAEEVQNYNWGDLEAGTFYKFFVVATDKASPQNSSEVITYEAATLGLSDEAFVSPNDDKFTVYDISRVQEGIRANFDLVNSPIRVSDFASYINLAEFSNANLFTKDNAAKVTNGKTFETVSAKSSGELVVEGDVFIVKAESGRIIKYLVVQKDMMKLKVAEGYPKISVNAYTQQVSLKFNKDCKVAYMVQLKKDSTYSENSFKEKLKNSDTHNVKSILANEEIILTDTHTVGEYKFVYLAMDKNGNFLDSIGTITFSIKADKPNVQKPEFERPENEIITDKKELEVKSNFDKVVEESKVRILVNGNPENAGTETVKTESGKIIRQVVVNPAIIEKKIEAAVAKGGVQKNNVEIPIVDVSSQQIRINLTGDIIKKLEDNEFNVIMTRNQLSYVIPAKELTIESIAKTMGVPNSQLKKIEIEVQMTRVDETLSKKYEAIVKENNSKLITPPIEFEIKANTTDSDGKVKTVDISKFSQYVERIVEIPEGIDPNKITTGIVFNPDGSYSHVPTEVFTKDGRWYAKLNSLTNSKYSAIWNPITVETVKNHWSKKVVDDMASRLVLIDYKTFEPDRAVTRAEFADYIVRALGLYREGGRINSKFTDVNLKHKNLISVSIANEWGIVNGYPDASFKPESTITREEAMTMYAKALKIAGLKSKDFNKLESYKDAKQISNWALEAVRETLNSEVFNGKAKDILAPKEMLTHAESLTAIRNLLVKAKLINQ